MRIMDGKLIQRECDYHIHIELTETEIKQLFVAYNSSSMNETTRNLIRSLGDRVSDLKHGIILWRSETHPP